MTNSSAHTLIAPAPQPGKPAPLSLKRHACALAVTSLVATLAACGGGGSSSSAEPPPPPPSPSTTPVSMTVVDGPLKNAVVCLDRNSNGLCDPDEPSAKTKRDGTASLDVPTADVGKFPIIAMVGTDAKDADTGPVTTAYILKAPPDATDVVSPLTTLVQTLRESTGSNTADAAAAIQSQLGLEGSVLANFTQDSSANGQLAATLARLIVVTAQTQTKNTEGALDVNDKPLSNAQISSVIHLQLLQQLQQLASTVLNNPTLSDTSKSIADKESAMSAAASKLADASGLNSSNAGLLLASQTSGNVSEPPPPTDTSSLRWLWFGAADNYYLRMFTATAAQNTPDAQGKLHFSEYRKSIYSGQAYPWVRPNIYWTGTEWFDCPNDFVNEITPSSTPGQFDSLYCKSLRSTTKQNVRDISGLSMRSVVKEIRSSPLLDSSEGSFMSWGADPESIPATAKWPAGSTLAYHNVIDYSADYYSRNTTISFADPATSSWRSASLAEFTSQNTGDFAPNVSLSQLNDKNAYAVASGPAYPNSDGNIAYKLYRVGFEAGGTQRVRFYECEVIGSGGSEASPAPAPAPVPTLPDDASGAAPATQVSQKTDAAPACTTILETSYSISNQGDAKVLRFKAEPTQLNTSYFPRERIFVERNGVTHVGFKDKPTTSFQQRLNKTATDALLATLGIN